MDRRCRASEGKVKIEGYMSISNEEAHHRDAQRAILRAHGDLDTLVVIQQSQCEIDISLDNLINDLSSAQL